MVGLFKYEVQSYEELEALQKDGFVICENKNDLSLSVKEPVILIFGSCIPKDLDYFYVKNSFMYKRIDASRNTNTEALRLLIKDKISIDKNILNLRNVLESEGIVFFDVCKYALKKERGNSDKGIKAFIFDERVDEYISSHPSIKEIIAISKDVEYVLKRRYKSLKIKYYHFFVGGPGTSVKRDDIAWKKLFDEYKKITVKMSH